MTARRVVVDEVEAWVRVLQAELTVEYYDVGQCGGGPAALRRSATGS